MTTVDGASGDRAAPQYPIESVDRALTLMQMLARGPSVRLSDVRDRLGVGQSTAHRLLAMFVYRGFAIRDPLTRTYAAGPALLDMRQGDGAGSRVTDAVRSVLVQLAAATRETASFAVLDGTDVRYIDDVQGQQALRVIGRTGQTRPAHATSVGRAMLAAESRDLVRARYRGEPLPAGTYTTISSVDDLLDELGRTLSRGYALNQGDVEHGICSVSVAVADDEGCVMGGLSIAAPEYRWGLEVERAHAELLLDAAAKLRRLASRAPRLAAE